MTFKGHRGCQYYTSSDIAVLAVVIILAGAFKLAPKAIGFPCDP